MRRLDDDTGRRDCWPAAAPGLAERLAPSRGRRRQRRDLGLRLSRSCAANTAAAAAAAGRQRHRFHTGESARHVVVSQLLRESPCAALISICTTWSILYRLAVATVTKLKASPTPTGVVSTTTCVVVNCGGSSPSTTPGQSRRPSLLHPDHARIHGLHHHHHHHHHGGHHHHHHQPHPHHHHHHHHHHQHHDKNGRMSPDRGSILDGDGDPADRPPSPSSSTTSSLKSMPSSAVTSTHSNERQHVRRPGPGVRAAARGRPRLRRALLALGVAAQADLHPEPGVSRPGAWPRHQADRRRQERQALAPAAARRDGHERLRQGRHGPGTGARERARFRRGLQVREDVRLAAGLATGRDQQQQQLRLGSGATESQRRQRFSTAAEQLLLVLRARTKLREYCKIAISFNTIN
ncbi:unnamed protein product [Trichogramma brassicae]|uniref:Uncharacterized protein n=1 Tax=Trichogramma brassicae TaxID=86971 RepID=A0A6H5J5V6_9HYME|nr:unnamed protein product [Trichogramma brassicae]